MVPALSIAFIVFNILFSIALPVFLFFFIREKYRVGLHPFLLGCTVWLVFAMVLEQGFHFLVLNTPTGSLIQSKVLFYALYGGLAAGIFEETGRFLAMKTLMKTEYGNDGNSLMYGAGHGGVEVLVLLGAGMVNNLIYSLLINTGHFELAAPLDGTQPDALQVALSQLVSTPSLSFLAASVERISALILHISLSVLVWFSVTRKRFWLFPLAIFLHFAVDAGSVLLSKGAGMEIWLVELVIFLFSALTAVLALCVWKKCSDVPVGLK